jgi:polysaccharide biosynthesis/export protein
MALRSSWLVKVFVQIISLISVTILLAQPSLAQLNGLSSDQLKALTGNLGSTGDTSDDGADNSSNTVQAFEGDTVMDLPSRLEIIYSSRANESLLQFGYDVFGKGQDVVTRRAGGLEDNYVIGVGDELLIDLRGQANNSHRVTVDNEGRIRLPNLDPLEVAGKRLIDVKLQLERRVGEAYMATNVFLSVLDVRQISVIVAGEVNNPGPLVLSGLSNSLDAVLLAGGIRKSGSLRKIKIIRGQQEFPIDLYSIALGLSSTSDYTLMDGDKIYVAPLGPTVAVGGWVKRPGIYELKEGENGLSVEGLIELAGGYEIRGRYALSLVQVGISGGVQVKDVNRKGAVMADGDLLLVAPSDERLKGAVTLEGHTRQKGVFSITQKPTLKALLADGEILGPRTYIPFGIVARVAKGTQIRTYVSFSPLEIVNGTSNLDLQEGDIVRILSTEDVQTISEYLAAIDAAQTISITDYSGQEQTLVETVNKSTRPPTTASEEEKERLRQDFSEENMGTMKLEKFVDREAANTRKAEAERLGNAQAQGLNLETAVSPYTAKELLSDGLESMNRNKGIDLNDPSLISLLRSSRVSIYGAVMAPGDYLIVEGISLGQALEIAGGLSPFADQSAVEITSTEFQPETGRAKTKRSSVAITKDVLDTLRLGPLDSVRIRRVFSDRLVGSVFVGGEVKFSGHFDLVRGERLSELLRRAGGLTQSAYPYGAVFTRLSAAQAERAANDQLASKMEGQLTSVVATRDIGTDSAAFLSNLIQQMRQIPTTGRISIEADPSVLMIDVKRDIILEPGDRLHIPSRPNSVMVVGEVLNPSGYHFEANLRSRDYIKQAGGFGPFADKRRAYIIMPDGRSRKLKSFAYGSSLIAPGSIIVVPRDLKPFQLDEFLLTMTQVSSQIALTAASLAVVVRD